MKSYANILFTIVIYFAVFCLVFFLLCFLLTRKFNKKYKKVYTIFTGLNFREIFLYATTFINLVIMVYFMIHSDYFFPVGSYMIIVLSFLSCFVAFNFKIIIVDMIYAVISCSLLWLLMTVRNYYHYFGNNVFVLILIIIFITLIAVYALFITMSKINILINIHKNKEVKSE